MLIAACSPVSCVGCRVTAWSGVLCATLPRPTEPHGARAVRSTCAPSLP
jgi:hypothetical protein